jgi:hypothetical protein
MSKKLIAIASALALSAAGFALPSSAAIETISGGNNADGLAPASAVVVPVPDNNEIAAGNLVTITVKSTQGKTVSATASAGVKLLTATTGSDGAWTSKDGSQTFSAIWSGLDITFYAFTTSTATGTVVVNDGIGNSQTRYIKGSAGAPYNIEVTTPNFVGAGASAQILVKVTDVFGNAIQGATTDVARKSATSVASAGTSALADATGGLEEIHASLVGGDAEIDTDAGTDVTGGVTATGIFDYDNKLKGYVGYLVGRTTDGQIALSVKLDPAATAVDGLAAPRDTFFKVINSGDQTAQIATLQAQIDTMRPKANSVTKKRYNTLARKWNAAFPSQRVALKK